MEGVVVFLNQGLDSSCPNGFPCLARFLPLTPPRSALLSRCQFPVSQVPSGTLLWSVIFMAPRYYNADSPLDVPFEFCPYT